MERVGIYNRCSTEEESQRNALAAQAEESREIAERQGWEIAAQYIESETGTVANRREGYQELLADMERNKFDIVMIKSIDRLTRSAKDWYFFLSRLTANRLRLYIYIERKFYTPDDNLISGIKAILAEDFSRELSKKIKNAHRRRQEKRSGCNITCEMFGWNRVAKDVYELNEEEAEYYRMAFALAREGKGFYSISNILYEEGARARSGRKISEVQWRKMLYTPRAHGTMILNTRTYNFDMKKYEEVPEENWITMENALPPIVSKEYQEEVTAILRARASRSRAGEGNMEKENAPESHAAEICPARDHTVKGHAVEGYAGKYALSHRLVCGLCGRYYYRVGSRKQEKEAMWKCSTFLHNGRRRNGENPGGCDNRNLTQREVYSAITDVFREHFSIWYEKEEELTKEFLHLIKKMLQSPNDSRELGWLERENRKLAARKSMLMEKLLGGVISDEDFKKYHGEADKKQKEIENKINGIKFRREKYNSYEMRLQEIKEAISKEKLIEQAITGELLKKAAHITVLKEGGFEIYFS